MIPAIEVSSTFGTHDIHVLGYFVDPSASALREHERAARTRREARMHEMLDKLKGLGYDVPFEAVERAAGPDRVSLGRPHLHQALVKAGHVPTNAAGFDSPIADGGPAFVPSHMLTPMGAIEVILDAGGLPVWAHPPGDVIDALLPPMIHAGLRGLEVYRPRNRRDHVLRLEQVCGSTGLFPTGGSDWHGPHGGSALGDFFVTGDAASRLLDAGGLLEGALDHGAGSFSTTSATAVEAMTAPTTATPAAPHSAISAARLPVMPPMPTTGTGTACTTRLRPVTPMTSPASRFVAVL